MNAHTSSIHTNVKNPSWKFRWTRYSKRDSFKPVNNIVSSSLVRAGSRMGPTYELHCCDNSVATHISYICYLCYTLSVLLSPMYYGLKLNEDMKHVFGLSIVVEIVLVEAGWLSSPVYAYLFRSQTSKELTVRNFFGNNIVTNKDCRSNRSKTTSVFMPTKARAGRGEPRVGGWCW